MGNVPHARLFYDEIQCIGSNHMMLPFRCSETHVTQTWTKSPASHGKKNLFLKKKNFRFFEGKKCPKKSWIFRKKLRSTSFWIFFERKKYFRNFERSIFLRIWKLFEFIYFISIYKSETFWSKMSVLKLLLGLKKVSLKMWVTQSLCAWLEDFHDTLTVLCLRPKMRLDFFCECRLFSPGLPLKLLLVAWAQR